MHSILKHDARTAVNHSARYPYILHSVSAHGRGYYLARFLTVLFLLFAAGYLAVHVLVAILDGLGVV